MLPVLTVLTVPAWRCGVTDIDRRRSILRWRRVRIGRWRVGWRRATGVDRR
jgi:hypothetical protein